MINVKQYAVLFGSAIFLAHCSEHKNQNFDSPVNLPPSNYSKPNDPRNENKNADASSERFHWNKFIYPNERGYASDLDMLSEQAFQQQFVQCRDPFSCPEGVGLLLTSKLDRTIHGCTAFLVEHDIIMTDSHCIPEDLKSPGSSGKGRMQIKFPSTNETVDIDYTIFTSDISDKNKFSQDYAILKLDGYTSNRPLMLSRSGFKDASQVKILKVSPGPDNTGTLAEMNCLVRQNLPLFPAFKNDQSPQASITDCYTVEGNSGSPILNEKNEVVGLVKSILKIEETPVGRIMNPQDIAALPRFTLATNISCIPDFSEPPTKLSDSCKEDMSGQKYYENFSNIYRETMRNAGASINNQVQEKMRDWANLNSTVFRWTFKPVTNEHPSYKAELDCIQPLAKWIGQYSNFLGFTKSEATMTGGAYTFGAGAGADKNFKLHPDARVWPLGTYEIKFDPSEVKSKGVAHLTIALKMNIMGHEFAIPVPQTVALCK
jgi:V8-like Glu-specific endopeptidase